MSDYRTGSQIKQAVKADIERQKVAYDEMMAPLQAAAGQTGRILLAKIEKIYEPI